MSESANGSSMARGPRLDPIGEAATAPSLARGPRLDPIGEAPATAVDAPTDPMESPFVKELIKQWRAQDAHGAWEGKSDAELLAPYILTKEQRRELPIMGDPDPETLWRLELFYNAVGLAIERATGVMVAPMMKMHHEGFGRLVLIAGRLVVINKHLRDVHRFGFDGMEQLAAEGAKQVAGGIEMINKFAEVAKYG